MRELPLSKGYVALVDDEDFEWANQWKWSATVNPDGRREGRGAFKVYACRWVTENGKRKKLYLHRELLGAYRGKVVDHANGDGLDCRRQNLRLTTQKENLKNGVNGAPLTQEEAMDAWN